MSRRENLTPDDTASIKRLARDGKTISETAGILGINPNTIGAHASRNGITFGLAPLSQAECAAIRRRWAAEMPRLRANVRAAVLAEISDDGSAVERRP